MMRKPIIAFAIVISGALAAGGQEKKIESSSLPAVVRKTVQEQSRGAIIKGYSVDVEHGRKVYEAEMVLDGHSKDIEIAQDGTLNEIEEEIAWAQLPARVRTALSAKAAASRIVKVEALTKGGKLVAYEAATITGSRKGEIQVGPQGEGLMHEE